MTSSTQPPPPSAIPGILNLKLNPVEKDFVEFLVATKGRSFEDLAGIFLATKNKFTFSGPKYRQLAVANHNLFKIFLR